MTTAILFGSIGVIAESSDLQRDAFNKAFRDAGLDWTWDRKTYAILLQRTGGRRRIEAYAEMKGAKVDAAALHRRKTEIFQARLGDGIPPRPGVTDVIAAARRAGVKTAFVTTTDRGNVESTLRAAGLSTRDFDFVGHRGLVTHPKPAAAIYLHALRALSIKAGDAMAVENTAASAKSALAAGIPTVAFPGDYHADDVFSDAVVAKADRLTPGLFGLEDAGETAA